MPVHPRGRGEHKKAKSEGNEGVGSSPRARGTPALELHAWLQDRFIPAGAGNTSTPDRAGSRSAVHPRGRGEHAFACFTASVAAGSSPRARGTLHPGAAAGKPRRFIPAGAGNTDEDPRRRAAHPVHPRGRGEHIGRSRPRLIVNGSSPRARGTRSSSSARNASTRFIPAGAGNTTACPRRSHRPPVHPRGRGEHLGRRLENMEADGSSPRARGTLGRRQSAGGGQRFIPAGAGNTSAGSVT